MSEIVDYLHEEVYRLLRKHGVEDGAAGDAAMMLCDRFRRDFGGERHYVPRSDKARRDRAIKAELAAGRKGAEVAERHGVHPSTVSRVARTEDEDGFGSSDWNL